MREEDTDGGGQLQVHFLPLSLGGRVGITLAPGRRGRDDQGRFWTRDLDEDLGRLTQTLGAQRLVSLLTREEMQGARIGGLVEAGLERGLHVLERPISPDSSSIDVESLRGLVDEVQAAAETGDTVVLASGDGLGRACLVAACFLVAQGRSPRRALELVRRVRGAQSLADPAHADAIEAFERGPGIAGPTSDHRVDADPEPPRWMDGSPSDVPGGATAVETRPERVAASTPVERARSAITAVETRPERVAAPTAEPPRTAGARRIASMYASTPAASGAAAGAIELSAGGAAASAPSTLRTREADPDPFRGDRSPLTARADAAGPIPSIREGPRGGIASASDPAPAHPILPASGPSWADPAPSAVPAPRGEPSNPVSSSWTPYESACVGVVLGAALGDALGAPLEAERDARRLVARFGAAGPRAPQVGTPPGGGPPRALGSDDTQLAECALETLIEARRGRLELESTLERLAERIARWGRGPEGGHRQPEPGCLEVAKRLADGQPWTTAASNSALGSAALPRAPAFGLAFADDLHRAEQWAAAQCRVTHRRQETVAAAAALALGVAHLTRGARVDAACSQMVAAACRASPRIASQLARALHDADVGIPPAVMFAHASEATAADALATAMYVVRRHPDDLEAALREGVMTPGDSDAVGGAIGALLGARLGAGALPRGWLAVLERREHLEAVALALAATR